MIGRKGCVNQDGCIMHEGPDDQTAEDGPCLAPSTPLSHALTILGIRHQCAVKVDRDSDSESLTPQCQYPK